MPLSNALLQLWSNAPGLPGPYLQENLAPYPYRQFDEMGTARPRTALAIGGQLKRSLTADLFTSLDHSQEGSVSLAVLDDGQTLWLDCELHLQPETGIPRRLSCS
ncbi:hypothetical protein AUP68_15185 [Ilyonectria robusta]